MLCQWVWLNADRNRSAFEKKRYKHVFNREQNITSLLSESAAALFWIEEKLSLMMWPNDVALMFADLVLHWVLISLRKLINFGGEIRFKVNISLSFQAADRRIKLFDANLVYYSVKLTYPLKPERSKSIKPFRTYYCISYISSSIKQSMLKINYNACTWT